MIPGAPDYDIDLSIDPSAIDALLAVTPEDVDSPDRLTYAKNVFIPLTTACRYTCTYCTYFDPPGQASLLDTAAIRDIVRDGAAAGCTEALFTFGDTPDDRYTEINSQLDDWGHDSIHSYLREACEIALEEGLLPHSNPGDQTPEQMDLVRDVNASMGVMLETTADVDAHAGPRRKNPGQRLATIRTAGELRVPFTTGILVGIGETWRDRAESLLAIREMHDRYGHIQEVLVQNVVPNERWRHDPPSIDTMRRVTAMARAAFPAEVSIQVPPNLSPVRSLIDCGVDDLGGVSPVTTDHINPDYAWPALDELESIAAEAGLPLQERLPVYDRFLPSDLRRDESTDDRNWLSPRIVAELTRSDAVGDRYRAAIA